MGWTPNLAGRAERPPALTVSIDTMIRPMLTYTNDDWGLSECEWGDLNNQGSRLGSPKSHDLGEMRQIDMESCIKLGLYQCKELCYESQNNYSIISRMTDLRNW